MQLRGSECKRRGAERVLGASAQKPGERDVKLARGHAKPVRAHAEAARSYAVPREPAWGDRGSRG